MNKIRVIYTAFRMQWKTTATNVVYFVLLLRAVLFGGVLAWIASQSKDPSVSTYILVGAPLMAIWEGVLHRVGWSLSGELWQGTLEFTMISRTPNIVVLFGKALAHLAYGIPSGIIAFITIILILRTTPDVSNLGLLLVSLLLVIVGLVITSLLFAPLAVLAGRRGGFFDAIIPFGTVLSGFLFPIDRLPYALEVVARLLPMSWAMDSVWQAIRGSESIWSVVLSWLAYFGTLALVLGVTYLLFKIVEKRVRITGVLSTY